MHSAGLSDTGHHLFKIDFRGQLEMSADDAEERDEVSHYFEWVNFSHLVKH